LAVGQQTTCTATVTDTGDQAPTAPTGTVAFTSSPAGTFAPAASCTLATDPADAQRAACSVTLTLPADPTAVTARYGGDTSHGASSGSVAVGTSDPTSTTVSCSPSSSMFYPTTATCTVDVVDTATSSATTPSGTITFTAPDGGTVDPTTCTLAAASDAVATARCQVSFTVLNTGTYHLVADYGGDGQHQASSGTGVVTVSSLPEF
jgi:hypothetical protein